LHSASFLFVIDPLPEYRDNGCYKIGAFDDNYASFRGQIRKNFMYLTVEQCAHVAYDMGKTFFGVRNFGNCYAANDDSKVVEKLSNLESSNECSDGVGKKLADNVYMFEDVSAEVYNSLHFIRLFQEFVVRKISSGIVTYIFAA